MSAHSLIEHFHLLAAAPGGVPKLRELILNLAVRGKLVQQDPDDEPASELLKRIQVEKARLVAKGKIRKDKPLPEIAEDEKPYELPQSWAYGRLGDIALSIKSGGTPSKQNPAYWDGNIPWASVKDLKFGEPITTTQDRITEAGLLAGSTLAEAGSILICTRMGLGKIGEAIIDVAINQDLKAVTLSSFIVKQYFINFYKTLSILGSGMTVAGIKQEELLGFVIPLPPLTEQSRIVAKVDELMALCDQLEAQQGHQAAAQARLVGTLLDTLTQSADAAAFADNWARLAEHFDGLFDTPESIAQLKQTILQLAVQGKLVPQDPNDEPASELLKKIRAEKDRLIQEGKIKKDKPLPEVGEDETAFDLPEGWEWVRLARVVTLLGDGLHGTPEYSAGTPYYFINGNNLISGNIVVKPSTKTVSLEQLQKHRKPLGETSVLVSINGTLGSVAFYNGEQVVLGKSACFFNLASFIDKRFIRLLIESPYFQLYASVNATGTTIRNLSLKAMNDLPVPLPPLPEQHRIVAKVDELLSVCDALSEKLIAARKLNQQLLDTLVEQVA